MRLGGDPIDGVPDDPNVGGGKQAPPGDGPGPDPSPEGDGGGGVSAAQLAARIAELEARLAEARDELELGAIERRIEAALVSAGVIDLETGRLLAQRALAESPDSEVEEVVRELVRRKPFLFESGVGAGVGAAYAPGGAARDEGEELASMATSARGTGEREDLMRYLRARRGV